MLVFVECFSLKTVSLAFSFSFSTAHSSKALQFACSHFWMHLLLCSCQDPALYTSTCDSLTLVAPTHSIEITTSNFAIDICCFTLSSQLYYLVFFPEILKSHIEKFTNVKEPWIGLQDDSASKSTYHTNLMMCVWFLRTDFGQRKSTPKSCPLIAIHSLWHAWAQTHTFWKKKC